MKNSKVSLLLAVVAIALFSFKSLSDHSKAIVEQKHGVFVFISSKPLDNYDYLGTVKLNQYKLGNMNSAVERVKEKYPNADAILVSEDLLHADAIKFND